MTEPSSEFAQNLRALREAQGLSIRALAARIGVSSVTIWKWEKGGSKPRAHLIPPLARALEVSPVSLTPLANGGTKAAAGAELSEPETVSQDQAATAANAPASQQEALSDVIARAKQMIADASGTGAGNITIIIEY